MRDQHAQFLRIKKLTGVGIVKAAARHNLREIQTERGADSHIDAARIRLNRVIVGGNTADEIAATAKRLMGEAGIEKLRKDAVRAIEIVFSLPLGTSINEARFFDECVTWAADYFGVPVLSAVAHRDEAAPHMHLILLPLRGGRMQGSDLVGNKQSLRAILDAFHKSVAHGYGLANQTRQKRYSNAIREQAAHRLLTELKRNPARFNEPNFKHALIELIKANPEPLMLAAGLTMPKPKPAREKSFIEIMTKPCKPEKSINPIGFDTTDHKEAVAKGTVTKHQTLCSVGFQNSACSKPAPARRYLTIGSAV